MTPPEATAAKTLVTGAGGHLGANLLRHLVANGQPVRAVLHTEGERASLAGLPISDVIIGDLRDPNIVRAAIDGCRNVFHCAAKISTVPGKQSELFGSNVLGTRVLLEAARAAEVDKVVVTSSFSAVGNRIDGAPSEESEPFDPLKPHLAYEQTKAAAEHECLKACAEGLRVVIATSTAILGPNDFKPSRMGRVLLNFARGRLPAYIPGGFEFVSTRDIVNGHCLAMARGRPGQKYIFSTAFLTMDELMTQLARITGHRRFPLRLPPAMVRPIAELAVRLAPLLAPRSEPLLTPAALRILRLGRRANIRKAKEELGYVPGSIEAALEDAYRHFVDRGLLSSRAKIEGTTSATIPLRR